jgi:hypothetical protein
MRSEFQIVQELKNSIHQLIPAKGLKFKFNPQGKMKDSGYPDAMIRVNFEDLSFQLIAEVSVHNSLPIFIEKISRLKSLCRHNNMVPVIIARYLSPQRQELCHKEGVCFIDLSGNVYLKYKSFYIERLGFSNKFPEKRNGRNPFSDKASLILRSMLKNVEHLWGIREMAEEIGLNPGYVSRMAEELEKRKYIARAKNKLRLRSPEGILDDWVRAYNFKKNKLLRYFCMAKSSSDILSKLSKMEIPDDIKYALSVQAGASLISPYSVFKEVHVYVRNQKDIEFFNNQLQLSSADQGANLLFMLPYYKNSVFFDIRIVKNLWVVSDIQLYLDLYEYPIRGREQAEHLFDKQLKDLFAKAKNQ